MEVGKLADTTVVALHFHRAFLSILRIIHLETRRIHPLHRSAALFSCAPDSLILCWAVPMTKSRANMAGKRGYGITFLS